MNTGLFKRNLCAKLVCGLAILALLLCLAGPGPAPARAEVQSSFTVDSTGDYEDETPGDGACATTGDVCTLRAAIQEANALDGHDVIEFAPGARSIMPSVGLPGLTDNAGATIRGGYDGSPGKVIIYGGSTTAAYGLNLASSNNRVQGLIIWGFDSSAIRVGGSDNIIGVNGDGVNDDLEGNIIMENGGYGVYVNSGDNTVIAGNWIGLDTLGGGSGEGNLTGIYVQGVNDVRIGTDGDGLSDALEGNVISNNTEYGILVEDNALYTIIAGNLIGLNAAGNAALVNGAANIYFKTGPVSGPEYARIGTNGDGISDSLERNVISGSDYGITFEHSHHNTIAGNYIGLDASGTVDLGSGSGITIHQSTDNIIGTDGDGQNDAAERNVVSGHPWSGIRIQSSADNTIAGNYVGTNATGTAALGNYVGISIFDSPGTLIGTDGNEQGDAAERNLISGNNYGVNLMGAITDTVVAGNYIGLNASGTAALGNVTGIALDTTPGIRIGTDGNGISDSLERNVISGNENGILIDNSDHNTIAGNYIGLDASGQTGISNDWGIYIDNSTGNLIGTDGDGQGDAAERNVISGNFASGVEVSFSTDTTIAGNYIGTNANGDAAIGNGDGIINYDSTSTLIGTNGDGQGDAAERNLISGNGHGVYCFFAQAGVIAGNYIGLNASGTAALGNNIGITTDATITYVRIGTDSDGQSDDLERNVISGNSLYGIGIFGNQTRVVGNYIGTDASGAADLGNLDAGIILYDSTANLVSHNRIAFNHGAANVSILSGTGHALSANEIYSGEGLGIDLNEDGVTPNDNQDPDTGPNNLQNYPVLQAALSFPGQTTITGTLNSVPSRIFRVEFFANPACDDTGYGEGQFYLGVYTATTNAQGNASFVFIHPAAVTDGYAVSATATDTDGNTSEFSACASVYGVTAPSATTQAATAVEFFSATLHGTVNANELTTAVSFQLTTVSGNYASPIIVAASPGSVSGAANTPVSGSASGLQAGVTYYYRVAATSAAGTTYGNEIRFTTLSLMQTYLAMIQR